MLGSTTRPQHRLVPPKLSDVDGAQPWPMYWEDLGPPIWPRVVDKRCRIREETQLLRNCCYWSVVDSFYFQIHNGLLSTIIYSLPTTLNALRISSKARSRAFLSSVSNPWLTQILRCPSRLMALTFSSACDTALSSVPRSMLNFMRSSPDWPDADSNPH